MRIPAAVYGQMDFATRDRYRHAVEKMAKSSRLSEGEVAEPCDSSGAAAGGQRNGNDDRAAHVGFYLIDKGVPQLEQAVEVRLSTFREAPRSSGRFPLAALSRHDRLHDGSLHRRLTGPAYAEGWGGWLLALLGLLSLSLYKSTGGRTGELACDRAGDAACAPTNGFLRQASPRNRARWSWSRRC